MLHVDACAQSATTAYPWKHDGGCLGGCSLSLSTAWSYPVGVMSEAQFGHIGDNVADSLVRIVWPWEIVEQLVHCTPQEILVLVCVV